MGLFDAWNPVMPSFCLSAFVNQDQVMRDRETLQFHLSKARRLSWVPASFLLLAISVSVLSLAASDIARLLGWSDVQNSISAALAGSLVIGRLIGGGIACVGLYYVCFYRLEKEELKEPDDRENAREWAHRHFGWASALAIALVVLGVVPAWNGLAEQGQYRAYWSGYELLVPKRHGDEYEEFIWNGHIARENVKVPEIDGPKGGKISGVEAFWFWQLGVAEGYTPYHLPEAAREKGLPLYVAIIALSAAREIGRGLLLLVAAYVLNFIYLILSRGRG